MSHLFRDCDIAIVGVGEARIGRDAGCTSWELHVEAIEAALDDCGLELEEVDGLISCPSTVDDHARHHVLLAEHLGMPFKRYTDSSRVGGAASTGAIRDAANAIRSGLADTVVISCADVQRTAVGRADTPVIKMAHYHSMDYEIPYGPTIMSLYALVARRWMHEYGWRPEDIASVAVSQRYNASLHPKAQKRERITIEDVVTSRMISDPLRLLNCSLISDGGAALVVTSGERAPSLRQRPVYLRGMGSAFSYYFPWNLPDYTDYLRMLVATSAKTAFRQAGVSPADMDLATIGDPIDICTLIGIEGLGFTKAGEGVEFIRDGRIQIGGELPVNPHGGCLSYAHPGAPCQHLHVIEAVRQLRGDCGDRQIAGARWAVTHALAGVVTSHSTLVLSNEGTI